MSLQGALPTGRPAANLTDRTTTVYPNTTGTALSTLGSKAAHLLLSTATEGRTVVRGRAVVALYEIVGVPAERWPIAGLKDTASELGHTSRDCHTEEQELYVANDDYFGEIHFCSLIR